MVSLRLKPKIIAELTERLPPTA